MSGFNIDEIKMIAEVERKMDSGEQPFVMFSGQRVAVPQTTMDVLGLAQGQTINHTIFMAVLQANLADCQAAIAMGKGDE